MCQMYVCVCLYVHASVYESWAGSGVESGFCDACLISDRLGAPPRTHSCHSTEQALTSPDTRALAFKDKTHSRTQPCVHIRIHTESPSSVQMPFSSQGVLETQHLCGKATISGQEAAILVESVSAALRRYVSQWPSDETGVPLKWLTDRWCQQCWWGERRGEQERRREESECCFSSGCS